MHPTYPMYQFFMPLVTLKERAQDPNFVAGVMRSANSGNAIAQFDYARLIKYGIFGPVTPEFARIRHSWLEASARNNYFPAKKLIVENAEKHGLKLHPEFLKNFMSELGYYVSYSWDDTIVLADILSRGVQGVQKNLHEAFRLYNTVRLQLGIITPSQQEKHAKASSGMKRIIEENPEFGQLKYQTLILPKDGYYVYAQSFPIEQPQAVSGRFFLVQRAGLAQQPLPAAPAQPAPATVQLMPAPGQYAAPHPTFAPSSSASASSSSSSSSSSSRAQLSRVQALPQQLPPLTPEQVELRKLIQRCTHITAVGKTQHETVHTFFREVGTQMRELSQKIGTFEADLQKTYEQLKNTQRETQTISSISNLSGNTFSSSLVIQKTNEPKPDHVLYKKATPKAFGFAPLPPQKQKLNPFEGLFSLAEASDFMEMLPKSTQEQAKQKPKKKNTKEEQELQDQIFLSDAPMEFEIIDDEAEKQEIDKDPDWVNEADDENSFRPRTSRRKRKTRDFGPAYYDFEFSDNEQQIDPDCAKRQTKKPRNK